ncbi:MAG: NADP oxidoreductase, partial [Pseudomonadales bacterium]|nr:NADP oxidoreductase [Pseudomonadales bacterium]
LLTIRLLVSPTELVGDESGRVKAIKLIKNEAYKSEDGTVRPRATDQEEEIPVGLVFRSVGYHGVALKDIPFDERAGVICNEQGRVTTTEGELVPGIYVAGWIKRGPTGVIGTNKTDAQETVACMVEDMKAGKLLQPAHVGVDEAKSFLESRQPHAISYQDWAAIDEAETSKGKASNRPRVKFTRLDDMLAVLGR